ncbi:phosphatidylinositol 4-phosphate 5-kinase-like protein 1 isoform X1 [Dreissena polymorpha]|uniref:phosphatidylinositol 4-phosphate 5-kinase-like protein 1 isoform X1 n=1 Tax=Dreissena polymorpha TaxID=45954 RepID=UPI00226506B5|nr:phosphatidylinositol 4-phosphate 5-kinase-like protein 1 isoform X1 [Dreissena polymorpha]XP_052219690.1 phosphatidylinositol 4-phosphate 5-kinase-like protein 1 isoform X1 [Dreissena polymorpha]
MARVEDVPHPMGPVIQVRSRWHYLRQRLKKRGVVEVDSSHPSSDMLSAMQAAFNKVFNEHPEGHGKEEIRMEDVEQIIKFDVQSKNGKTYTFCSYASPVFARMRRAVDVPEEDFVASLVSSQSPYLEFISNSRSGQDFYFTNNQRFILKTDHQHCIQFFLGILRTYLTHFLVYPHSLLVKFLGIYSIKTTATRKKYFLVMQSIFYPTIRLEERFDIKGCLANRYQDPNPPGKKTIIVLKDQNFQEEKIELGAQKKWFLTQLRADVDFLKGIEVQDYSLLLGRHPLHTGEKRLSVGNLVMRVQKSFGHKLDPDTDVDNDHQGETPGKTPSESRVQTSTGTRVQTGTGTRVQTAEGNHNDMEMEVVLKTPTSKSASSTKSKTVRGLEERMIRSRSQRKISFLHSLSDSEYLDNSGYKLKNRRLLLNNENCLHIIDGEQYRYYVGVIDFFTVFGCRQQVAKILKDIKNCCGSHSSVPPEVYGERFFEFIKERVV